MGRGEEPAAMGGILLLFFLGLGLWEGTPGTVVTAGICEDANSMSRGDAGVTGLNSTDRQERLRPFIWD